MAKPPSGPVILIEFNELSPVLTQQFIAEGKLPNFKRFYDEAEVYVTEPEERAPYLEPWIQWITVHSGLNYRQHQIFQLGRGHQMEEKCIWDTLSNTGHRVWICGSMNVRHDLPLRGWVIPDPWTTESQPYPSELLPYFEFVQRNVVDSSKDEIPLSLRDYARFLKFMASHGLSIETTLAIVKQLVGERVGTRRRWKRAVLLDKLQFDLFQWHYRSYRPDFSTFFLNSTAHFQHFYWRNMRPELFKVQPSREEQAEFSNAILFGYQEMDRLLERFFELAGNDATLILCTALSQQPCLKYEDDGGKVIYRPSDFTEFLTFAGVTAPFKVAPIMAEEFIVYLEDEAAALAAEKQLRSLTLDGDEVMNARLESGSVSCSCRITHKLSRDVVVKSKATNRTAAFFDMFYQIEGIKSGMHHPDGMFWLRGPDHAHQVHQAKLPLDAIAPMILGMFGIEEAHSEMARHHSSAGEVYSSQTHP